VAAMHESVSAIQFLSEIRREEKNEMKTQKKGNERKKNNNKKRTERIKERK
jgi:hypothetical protein